jgi:hypothetical protein
MRLWTLHPRYLDSQGLVAAWREALLAQKVLMGRTRGYKNHPQLLRFKSQKKPIAALAIFLKGIAEEASLRNYQFDTSKISKHKSHPQRIPETKGQLLYEWNHLKKKLRKRSPQLYKKSHGTKIPKPHPLFEIVPGKVREWEKLPSAEPRRNTLPACI